jgi:hypothetical protein
VTPAEGGGSVVIWTATIRSADVGRAAKEICEGTRAVFEAGIAALAWVAPVGGSVALPPPAPLET